MTVASYFVSWDIETAELIPEGGLQEDTRLGIACAATLTHPGDSLRLWHGALDPDEYETKMSPGQLFYMLEYLYGLAETGASIMGWNIAGFDFRVLHDELTDGQAKAWCKKLALQSVDPFFAMMCSKGYGIGLDTACKGMGVEGKTEGMKGALAPEMWKEGRAQQDRVLEYVTQDVRAQANVYLAMLEAKQIRWTSRSGRANDWVAPTRFTDTGRRLWTVEECLTIALPETGWMTKPRTREDYTGWIGEIPSQKLEVKEA